MKIALSLQNGIDLSGHPGQCSQFLIYSIEDNKVASKQLLELDFENTLHTVFFNQSPPYRDHPLFECQIIISEPTGCGFVNKVKIKDIEAIQTLEKDPDRIISKYLDGSLELSEPIS